MYSEDNNEGQVGCFGLFKKISCSLSCGGSSSSIQEIEPLSSSASSTPSPPLQKQQQKQQQLPQPLQPATQPHDIQEPFELPWDEQTQPMPEDVDYLPSLDASFLKEEVAPSPPKKRKTLADAAAAVPALGKPKKRKRDEDSVEVQ
jgi:hypothetical protein